MKRKRHPGGMMPPRAPRTLKELTPNMGPMPPRPLMGPMPLSHMPRSGQLSPCGDLGELKQLEALEVFPDLKKITNHVKRASHSFPIPRGLR